MTVRFRLRLPSAKLVGLIVVIGSMVAPAWASGPTVKGDLRVRGRSFVDGAGRVVLLRGVNLAGNSKVPPFVPLTDPAALDVLPQLGFNVVRLIVTWEALEPRRGVYDEQYMGRMRAIASEIAARGMYVILDIHQDGFSRFVSRGSGDGFPPWAVSSRARLHEPDNTERSKNWPILVATDPAMHRSFSDFYSDTAGVRTRYLEMVRLLARTFAAEPGVIGYDLLNEPWGREKRELAPLYRDAARVIRAEDPTAILFLEGHVTTNMGVQTKLPPPEFENAVYAPHYYKPTTIVTGVWLGDKLSVHHAFSVMGRKAEQWGTPLFLGEFGAPATGHGVGDYVAFLYDKLDQQLASGAQWNFTPDWDEVKKDGWNGEDFHIVDLRTGEPRGNFRPRPFPRAVAGQPLGFKYEEPRKGRGASIDFLADHDPALGPTEIFLPASLFPPHASIQVEPAHAVIERDLVGQILLVRSAQPGRVRVRVE